MLEKELETVIGETYCEDDSVRKRFLERFLEGEYTRDENPISHFCAYFLPYDKKTGKFFFIHHKKSGLWISPGGHIDKGEGILDTLNREIEEELGVKAFFKKLPESFYFEMTPVANKVQPCREHYDIWYLMETDGKNFKINPEEFLGSSWFTREEAFSKVTDPSNLEAMKIVQQIK
jgi:8-oxo-dGTP pyrophosphatase MutT (NUDIX family)